MERTGRRRRAISANSAGPPFTKTLCGLMRTNMTFMSKPRALRGGGQPIEPGDGVVPILQEVGSKRLKVVGTGFYITRYGLVATAKHVVEEMRMPEELQLLPGFILHLAPDNTIFLRPIRRAHLLRAADVAVIQADNFMDRHSVPLMNLRPRLSVDLPAAGEPLVTYANPENAILDFNVPDHVPEVRGDYFQGGLPAVRTSVGAPVSSVSVLRELG